MSKEVNQLREACLEDFWTFAQVVSKRYFGDVHREVSRFLQHAPTRDKLLLIPRDHQKSVIIALYCAWLIVRDPTITIAYVTATQGLAKKQIRFIQNILESDVVRELWPDLFPWYYDTAIGRWTWSKRDITYTNEEFEVGHPLRREKNIPELTVTSASVGVGKTGFHFQVLIFDDLVVHDNYTEQGRQKVRDTYALWSSIATTQCETIVVGTRYGPKDLYQDLIEEVVEDYDDNMGLVGTKPTYTVFERAVEDKGDGTGNFLWPRRRTEYGEYGFNARELAFKRAKYRNKMDQFYCQYYNDPNRGELMDRSKDIFQYMNPSKLVRRNLGASWEYNRKPLKLYAGMDCAWSNSKGSDYNAIVVLGVDSNNFKYVLDIERFKASGKPHEYYDVAVTLQEKWGFRKMNIETNAGGKFVLQVIKDRFRDCGISCSIQGDHKNKAIDSKQQRKEQFVLPLYDNGEIWHFPCGNINLLEDELILPKPPHDDIADALGNALSIAKKPLKSTETTHNVTQLRTHPKFGGVIR